MKNIFYLNFQEISINHKSLPKQVELFRLSNCGLTKIHQNSFAHCHDLKTIIFENLKELHLKKRFYSQKEVETEVSNLTLTKIGLVKLSNEAFSNFPKTTRSFFSEIGLPEVGERGLEILTDTFIISNSNIGKLEKGNIVTYLFFYHITMYE